MAKKSAADSTSQSELAVFLNPIPMTFGHEQWWMLWPAATIFIRGILIRFTASDNLSSPLRFSEI
jgi:hypothetical protein